jgi:hypothetical protein
MFDDSVMKVLAWEKCLELLEEIGAPFKPQIVVTYDCNLVLER